MIVFNIITNNHELIDPLMNCILNNHYAQSVQLDHEIKHVLENDNSVKEVKTPKISFITRAVLYGEIEETIKSVFPGNDFMFYSIPISQMNEKHGNMLRNTLKQSNTNSNISNT